nr:LysR family transcriptional regulator [Croceicoccus gelatinilyticus]
MQNFLAIARHGTLSAAARALGVTQPTMGRRLASLEETTGTRLLVRTPEGFVLTALGEQVLARAETMEEEALAAELLINSSNVQLDGLVRLTTVETLAGQFVAPCLIDLQRDHPGMAFELVPATQSLSLSRREADIAIRMRRFEGGMVVERKIGSLALAAYQAANADPEEVSRRYVTVLHDQSHLPEAKLLEQTFRESVPSIRSNNRDVQYQAVCNGGGIGLLPRFRADHDPRLVRVRPDLPVIKREIWLGIHSDLRKMPRMRVTMDALIDTFAKNAHLLDPDD